MADIGEAASTALATAVATAAAAATTAADVDGDAPPECDSGNGYNGYFSVRVSAIFVILVCSFLGKFDSRACKPDASLTFPRRRLSGVGST